MPGNAEHVIWTLVRIGSQQTAIGTEAHTEAWPIRHPHPPTQRHSLIGQERRTHWRDRVCLRRHH